MCPTEASKYRFKLDPRFICEAGRLGGNLITFILNLAGWNAGFDVRIYFGLAFFRYFVLTLM